MPHSHAGVVSSSSHLQLTVIRALKTYQNRTKKDLFAHPLAAQLRACNSPDAVFRVLRRQVEVHDRPRCGHERLTHCLEPTVKVLYTFSLALEKGVGLDISLAKPILAGVGVLILAARDVRAGYGIIAGVFEYIVHFFRRLELYSEVSPTNGMKNIIARMLAEVLSILAIATEEMEIKRFRMKSWLKKLVGMPHDSHIKDALRSLDKLTREEARMSTSQVLKAIIMSMHDDTKSAAEIVYDGKDAEVAMQEKVDDVDEAKLSSSHKFICPCDTVYPCEKGDPPPRYTPPPAYGTREKVDLLLGRGAMVETKDNEDKTMLDGL